MSTKITSFHMPDPVVVFLEEALRIDLILVSDIWALTMNHKDDFVAIMAEVVEYAFENRHCTDQHAIMCNLQDVAMADIRSRLDRD